MTINKEATLEKIEPLLRDYYKSYNNKEFIPNKTKVSVGWPLFDEKEVMHVLSSLMDMRISQGPAVLEFEKNFADYISMKYAVGVNSGSSANLLALAVLLEANDLEKGDEVIVPAATFTTVASPILQLGLTPVFVDIDIETLNINTKEIEKAIGPKTKVLMPVHSLGNPADMLKIIDIAKKHNLKVLEDCCEAHGASIDGKKVGSFSDMATFSFFVAHNMTTGEGGMVFTNNPLYDKLLRSMREFGRFNEEKIGRFEYKDDLLGFYDTRYLFQRLGYNMRMTDITASVGVEQLTKLDKLNDRRIETSRYYIDNLKKYENWLELPNPKKNTVHTYYSFALVIKKGAPFSRKDITKFLEDNNIETRPFFGGCLPDQPAFRDKPIKIVGNLSVSRHIRDSAFFIGCHPAITNEGRVYVVGKIKEFLDRF